MCERGVLGVPRAVSRALPPMDCCGRWNGGGSWLVRSDSASSVLKVPVCAPYAEPRPDIVHEPYVRLRQLLPSAAEFFVKLAEDSDIAARIGRPGATRCLANARG
jgi:hypothetical protein